MRKTVTRVKTFNSSDVDCDDYMNKFMEKTPMFKLLAITKTECFYTGSVKYVTTIVYETEVHYEKN